MTRALLAVLLASCAGAPAPARPAQPAAATPAELLEGGCACADDACRAAADAELAAVYRAADNETILATVPSVYVMQDCLSSTEETALVALARRAFALVAGETCHCRDAACLAEVDEKYASFDGPYNQFFVHGINDAAVRVEIDRMTACHRALVGETAGAAP